MDSIVHPIMKQSFAVIDREIGEHNFSSAEYAIVRRIIHSTADFEFQHLIHFSPDAIESGISALTLGLPIITDVEMVKQGIIGLMSRTFENPVISAIEGVKEALPGKTRTQTGLLKLVKEFPEAIYVIGNAPTALIALCEELATTFKEEDLPRPSLVIGAPVGFISVVESKLTLAKANVPQIRIEERKGGSSVAAAILNALVMLAWERQTITNKV